jgi:hypothetical protein
LRRTRSVLVLSIALAAGLVVTAACQRRRSAPLPDVDRPLSLLSGPTLAGYTTSGPPIDLAALHGKVVVVSFWAPS